VNGEAPGEPPDGGVPPGVPEDWNVASTITGRPKLPPPEKAAGTGDENGGTAPKVGVCPPEPKDGGKTGPNQVPPVSSQTAVPGSSNVRPEETAPEGLGGCSPAMMPAPVSACEKGMSPKGPVCGNHRYFPGADAWLPDAADAAGTVAGAPPAAGEMGTIPGGKTSVIRGGGSPAFPPGASSPGAARSSAATSGGSRNSEGSIRLVDMRFPHRARTKFAPSVNNGSPRASRTGRLVQ
jgi:hypothetical protein